MLEIEFSSVAGEKSYLCPEGSYIPVTDSVISLQDIYKHRPEGANMITKSICQTTECNGIVHAKSLCHKHYLQFQRHGKIFERTQYDPNKIEVLGTLAYITLYDRSNTASTKTVIDANDVELIKKYRWSLHDRKGYINNQNKVLLHRIIMNAAVGQIVDHINRNPLDNRKENLRFVSLSKNVHNSKIHTTNTSGVKGVYFHKASGGWEASIQIDGIKKTKLFRGFDDAVNYRKEHEVKI